MFDWDLGRYEVTAAELEPVAEHVVSLAELTAGQRVLDLATGTGNAALRAARTGAAVTGVDSAPRLVDVARGRAASAEFEIEFLVADVQALPFADRAFDVALSVFGVIFAADADQAFAELVRVLAPPGRALISVWVPAGPIDAMITVFARAVSQVTGSAPQRFAWHDAVAVSELAQRHGATVAWHEGQLRITAESAEAYLAAGEQNHPMSLAMRPLVEQAGLGATVREQALQGAPRRQRRSSRVQRPQPIPRDRRPRLRRFTPSRAPPSRELQDRRAVAFTREGHSRQVNDTSPQTTAIAPATMSTKPCCESVSTGSRCTTFPFPRYTPQPTITKPAPIAISSSITQLPEKQQDALLRSYCPLPVPQAVASRDEQRHCG